MQKKKAVLSSHLNIWLYCLSQQPTSSHDVPSLIQGQVCQHSDTRSVIKHQIFLLPPSELDACLYVQAYIPQVLEGQVGGMS